MNFLTVLIIEYTQVTYGGALTRFNLEQIVIFLKICIFPCIHLLKSLYMIFRWFFILKKKFHVPVVIIYAGPLLIPASGW